LPSAWFYKRWLQRLLPIVVCLLTCVLVYRFYRDTPGLNGIHGIAEAREYAVSPVEDGRLASVRVVLGQRVSRGQVLAVLEKDVLEQEIRVAEAECRELQADIAAENQSLDMSNLETVRNFQSDLEKAEIELNALQAECTREKADWDAIQPELKRQRELVQRRLISSKRMHELEIDSKRLQEGLHTCPARIESLERRKVAAAGRYEEWQRQRQGDMGRGGSQEQLRPLQLRSVRAGEYVRLLKVRLDNMVLRAPADGFVAGYLNGAIAMAGDVVRPGTPILMVVEADPQQVIAYIEEERGLRVSVGQKAVLRPRNKSGIHMEGAVTAVAETMSQLPTRFWPSPTRPSWGRQIFIRIPSEHNLTPGATFDISFQQSDPTSLFLSMTASAEKIEGGFSAIKKLTPLHVPAELQKRSRLEPSGAIWSEKLHRYLVVSDDTGLEGNQEDAPWLFTLAENGQVDTEPIRIEGMKSVSDLEGIAASPEGKIYVMASQSVNKKGKRPSFRTIFASLAVHGNRLQLEGWVHFYDLLQKAAGQDRRLLKALGLGVSSDAENPRLEIEGLTWHDGALYLGLKDPIDDRGRALIWRLADPDALLREQSFSHAGLTLWRTVQLPIQGKPAGISEILFLPGNKLVLAAVGEESGGLFYVADTERESLQPQLMGMFPGHKPEGLCLAPDRRLMVLFDEQGNDPLYTHLELPL